MKITNLSIRLKTLIIVALGVVLLAISVYIVSSVVLNASYLTIEKDDTIRNVGRVSDALDEVIAQLNIKTTDWAAWDDTYQFVDDKNQEYIESNLGTSVMASLKVNTEVFVDGTGNVSFIKLIDLNTTEELNAQSITDYIKAHPDLLAHKNTQDSISGIIVIPEGALIIASRPIITSLREGPINGTVIFGQFLDKAMIEKISKITHVTMELHPYASTNLPEDILLAKQELSNGLENFINPLSSNSIAGYKIIKDIHGEPISILKIITNRDVYNQGKFSFYVFISVSVVAIVLFGILLSFILNYFVVSRFLRLSSEVKAIGESKDLSKNVKEDSEDEVGILAKAINKMLKDIKLSQEVEHKLTAQAKIDEAELQVRFDEMERMNKLMVDRELQMSELKKENERLKAKGLI